MPYFCTTPGCYFQKKNYSYPIAGNCQECGHPFTLIVEFDAFELDVINNYPYVIAFPFKRMIEESDYFTKFSILKDVFVNALKFSALLVATEYFKSPFKSDSLNKLFVEKLWRPQHGHWNEFLKQAIGFLEEKNYNFLVKELPFFYHAIETGSKNNWVKRYTITNEFTNKAGRLETKKEELTAINALLYYRNEKFAHTQTISTATAKEVYFTCYAILKDFLAAISFCKDYPMYKADRVHFYSLMGANVTNAGTLTEVLNEKDNVWIQNKQGEKMSLLPFFVQPSQYIAGANNTMQVLMYEGNTGVGGRMIFDSPESFKPEAQGEILNMFYSLLANKQLLETYTTDNYTNTNLKERLLILNNRVYTQLVDENKLLKGIYQKREDAEVVLLSWAGARASLFIITAEAGSGKTNLLWNIKIAYQEKFGLDVLLLRASRFEYDTLAQQLQQQLHLANNFDFAQSTAFSYTRAKPLMFLVDGGNEHPNQTLLLQSIINFVQLFKIGSVKVVLTWRVNTNDEIPQLEADWQDWVYNSTNTEDKPQQYFWLAPLNKIELQGAWNHYVAPTTTRYKPLFTLNELTLHDRPLADQLHNPLLLKLFLELQNGKTLTSKPKGFSNIWADWWKQRIYKQPNHAKFLIHLAVLMADKQVNRLPLDSLYDDATIGSYVRNYQIDSPYQQLLQSSTLTQYSINNRLYVSITIEAVLHYALSQYLIEQRKGNQLASYIGKGQHWQQAVAYCLWDAAIKGKIYLLQPAIKNTAIPINLLAKPLATAFITNDIQQVVDTVLDKAGEREWEILHEAVDVLDIAQKNQLVKAVIQKIVVKIDLTNYECKVFVASHLMSLRREQALEFYDNLMKNISLKSLIDRDLALIDDLADYLGYTGQFDKSLDLYQSVLKNKLSKYDNEHPDIATSYSNVAFILEMKGNYNEALDYFQKCHNILLKFHGQEHPYVAISYNNMAVILNARGNYDEALDYSQKGLEIKLKLFGVEHPNVATSYRNIASILEINGRYDEALDYCHKCLEIELKLFGEEDSNVASTYNTIALILSSLGEYDRALTYYQNGLEINQVLHGTEHPDVARSFNNIAVILYTIGEYDKSLFFYQKSHEIKLKFHDNDHPDIATSLNNIALVLNSKGKYDEALDYCQKGLEIKLKVHGFVHSSVSSSYSNIALILKSKGQYDEALTNYEKSLEIDLKLHGEEHSYVATSYRNIASILIAKGKNIESLGYCQKSIDIELKYHGEEHIYTGASYITMGLIYEYMKDYITALRFYFKSMTIIKKILPSNNPDLAAVNWHIGNVYIKQIELEKGFSFLSTANHIYLQHFDDSHPKIADLNNSYGLYYEKLGDFINARRYYEKAHKVKFELLGAENEEVKAILESIERVKNF